LAGVFLRAGRGQDETGWEANIVRQIVTILAGDRSIDGGTALSSLPGLLSLLITKTAAYPGKGRLVANAGRRLAREGRFITLIVRPRCPIDGLVVNIWTE
jgi:hypothetical protein